MTYLFDRRKEPRMAELERRVEALEALVEQLSAPKPRGRPRKKQPIKNNATIHNNV